MNFQTIAKKLEKLPKQEPPNGSPFCESVRHLAIIASSSRGGSSVFAELLRRCNNLLHFRAEINPMLYVNGLTYPVSGTGSDALDETHLTAAVRQNLSCDLSLECGNPKLGGLSTREFENYAIAVARRLTIQWPAYTFNYESTRRWLLDTFEHLEGRGWERNEMRDPQLFWCLFLQKVRAEFPNISPYAYDINPQLIQKLFPDLAVPDGPPPATLIEEPPFIIPVPMKHPIEEELALKPLVVKTPSNVYRFDFLRSLFPNATPWILHLTRNAPNAINGLYDGWCHRGFFSPSCAWETDHQGLLRSFSGMGLGLVEFRSPAALAGIYIPQSRRSLWISVVLGPPRDV